MADRGPVIPKGRVRAVVPAPGATFLLALLAAAIACEGGGEPRSAVVRDSAGIAIIENVSPDDSTAWDWWSIGPPLTDIGGEGAAGHDLFRVSHAILLPDGRFVVANSGSSELRFFDATGSLLQAVGRRGEGPGEFLGISWLSAVGGDTLYVYDGYASRMSVYHPDGTFIRDFVFGGQGMRATAIGRFADGTFAGRETVLLRPSQDGPIEGLQRPDVSIVRVNGLGEVEATLGPFPGAERFINVNADGGGVVAVEVVTPLLGRTAWHVATGNVLWSGTQDGPELRVYDPEGSLVRIVRTGRAPEPVTDRHREALIAKRLESVPDDRVAAVRSGLEALAVAEFVPPYGRLVADRAGNLWVADYDDGLGPAGRWTVYSAAGHGLARIALPERFTPYDIGEEWILGKELDDLDIEHLRLYPLMRN